MDNIDVQDKDGFLEGKKPVTTQEFVVPEVSVKTEPPKKQMGRPKGSKMPEEAKLKIAAAKKAWWAAKKASQTQEV